MSNYIRRNRISKLITLLLATILILSTIGCGKNGEKAEEKVDKKSDKVQIGVTFDSFVIERWQRDRDVFVSMAKELGAEVNVQSANGDVEEQIKQIDYFIDSGMDVIVIICIDSDSLADSVAKAKSAGVKVVAYDRLIRNANVDLYISFDNEKVGEMMGMSIAQEMKAKGIEEGSVLMLGGDSADNNVPLLEGGFMRVMEENNITVLDSTHAEGWRAEYAAEYMYDHMDLVEQADAIMCGNDNLGSQAYRVLSEYRLAGKKILVGQDADLEACQRIVEGVQLMTVYKPVEKLASLSAKCTVNLANGEELKDVEVLTINDGTYDVPYVKLDPISVTADNMDEVIINGGFHLKEDVYLNVPDKVSK